MCCRLTAIQLVLTLPHMRPPPPPPRRHTRQTGQNGEQTTRTDGRTHAIQIDRDHQICGGQSTDNSFQEEFPHPIPIQLHTFHLACSLSRNWNCQAPVAAAATGANTSYNCRNRTNQFVRNLFPIYVLAGEEGHPNDTSQPDRAHLEVHV